MTYEENYLAHYGIKGQKWGIRRFQNADGSLTPEGIRRYGSLENFNRQRGIVGKSDKPPKYAKVDGRASQKMPKNAKSLTKEQQEELSRKRKEKTKKILKIAGAVTLAAAAGYLAYKIGDQWTTNLQEEFNNQAKKESDDAFWNWFKADKMKRESLSDAKLANFNLKTKGAHYAGRYHDINARHLAVRNALGASRVERPARNIYEYYRDLPKNTTKLDLVKNYIKNHGSIVLPKYLG